MRKIPTLRQNRAEGWGNLEIGDNDRKGWASPPSTKTTYDLQSVGEVLGFILLNELAHKLQDVTKFVPDRGHPDLNEKNSMMLLEKCYLDFKPKAKR